MVRSTLGIEPARAPLGEQPPAAAGGGKPRHVQRGKLALDVGLLVLALVASRLSASLGDATLVPVGWTLAFGALVIVNLAAAGQYRPRFVLAFLDDARAIAGATAIAAMTVSFARLLFADDPSIATQASQLWLFSAAYLTAGHGAVGLIRARARRLGVGGEPTLIVGAGRVGHSVARRLLERPEFGLRPVAFLDDEPLPVDEPVALPVVQGVPGQLAERLGETIAERKIAHVILAFSLASHGEELALVRRCTDLGASVSLIPRLFEGVPDQTRLERIGGIPLITVAPADPRALRFRIKYAIERAIAAGVVVALSPVLVAAAVGTLLSVGRPILFRQERVGLDGKEFQMLKFRSMRGDPSEAGEADAAWAASMVGEAEGVLEAAVPSAPAASRTTRLGRMLRKSSVDELPQLFNVVRGEMTLIGPRPERRSYVELFERRIQRYDDRHRVKSGMTGWAQVHGLRGETSLSDRVEWDNYYIENWSFWLDFKIALLTVLAVFRGQRA